MPINNAYEVLEVEIDYNPIYEKFSISIYNYK